MKEGKEGVEIDRKSKDLIKKWQRQGESLKKKHPKWNAEKIQKKKKKRILQDAEAALSTRSGKAYVEEVNAHLREVADARKKAIDGIMAYMGKTSPEAIAAVLFELDCGCLRACAVSPKGTPMGEMIMVFGKQVEKDYECSVCRDDGGADPGRCIRKSLIWPGEDSELPSEEFRLYIGKKVFGDDYSLDDI